MSHTTAISIKGLSVSYGRKRVLSNIYLEIEPGAVVGVIGPNGAGKSTLFKAVMGLLDHYTGEVRVLGQPVEKVRKRLAYIPQRDDIDWNFPATVYDVAVMGRYPHKGLLERLDAHDHAIVQKALADMGIEHLKHRQIGELSGGQQQRVFLARALAQEADILLLDEPFVGVDITTEERIIQILKRLAGEGKTVLVVHHDLSTVRAYFDKVVLLNQRLIAYGDTDTAFTEDNVAATYRSQLTILHQAGLVE